MEAHRNDTARPRRRAWEGYLLAGICLTNLLITAAMLLVATSPAVAGALSVLGHIADLRP